MGFRFLVWVISLALLAPVSVAEKAAVQDFVVKSIKLRGVKDHPEQGINNFLLERQVNQWREELHPYPRLTFSQLQDIAYRISKYYQDLGFSFVNAYLPKQKIKRGVVVIQIKEDILASVHVRNVDESTQAVIASNFDDLIGKPVFKPNLEEPILLLNDNPNREVFAFFSRGKNAGETRLNLNVQELQTNQFRLGVNNTGSKSTGENRWWLAGDTRNLFGWDDVISLNITQPFNESANLFGNMTYKQFLDSRQSLEYSLVRNEYKLGEDLAALKLSGEYNSLQFTYRNKTKRIFSESASEVYSFEYRSSQLTSGLIQRLLDTETSAILFNQQFLRTDYQPLMGDSLTRSFQSSLIIPTSDDPQISDDALIKFSGLFISGVNLGYPPGWQARFNSKLIMQYSPQVLPSADKASLSGTGAVRAFDTGVFSADESVVVQLQTVFMNAGVMGTIEPYIFYDHAYGVRKSLSDDIGAQLSGYGIGLKYAWNKIISVDLMAAQSLKSEIGQLPGESSSKILLTLDAQVWNQ